MNLMFFYCFNLLFVSFSLQINAEFNKHFANFIVENYGKSFLDILERKDLGPGGSFGGRTVEDEEINRDPVIFVHGVSDIAEGKMQSLAEIYRKQGYSDGELYSTTYASGAKNNPVSWAEYSLKCSYVKQITAKIPGENGHASYKNFTHDSILLNTWSVQFNMIENHSSQDLPINKKQNKKQNVNESESENEHEKRKKIQSRSLRSRESSQKKSRVLSRQITSASPIDNDFLQTTVKPVKSTTLNSQVTDTYHSNNIVNSHGMQEKHIITTMETAQEADFIADKGEGYHTRFQISLDKQNK
uniref:Uncharacterized protein n=1 Tax=Caenorhabditis japonica TaxID=281687 RepID=A0A8R1DN81_CAEJA